MTCLSRPYLSQFYDSPASGANGAVIHYKPEPESCSIVDANKLFLLDSGAQYVDGTTDITRTVHFGKPTARERECFTRVLQVPFLVDCMFCLCQLSILAKRLHIIYIILVNVSFVRGHGFD